MDDKVPVELSRLVWQIRRHRRDAGLVRTVHALMSNSPRSVLTEDAKSVVREVCHPQANRWRQSALAAWAVSRMDLGPDVRAEVEAALIRFADRRQMDERASATVEMIGKGALYAAALFAVLGIGASVVALPFLGVLAAISVLVSALVFSVSICVVTFFLSLPLAPVISLHLREAAQTPRRFAIQTLGKWQSVGAAGPLAREAIRGAWREPWVAIEALAEALPKIGPEHYGSLSAADQTSLSELLQTRHVPSSLKLEVLRALGHIGGAPALPAVMAAAERAEDDQIRTAAMAILPSVTARAAKERESAVLMRSVEEVPKLGDILIRPAAPSADFDTSLLVRPSGPESDCDGFAA